MDETTQPFDYNSPRITGIIDSLSESRFQTYLDKFDGDQVAAIQLYTWNTSIAGAFYGPLQTLEILLRNKVHALLRNSHGSRWFDNSSLLRKAEDRMVQEATQRLIALGKTPTEGRVVADLSFGFWVALFANAYDETIWRTDLYRLFPKPVRNRRAPLR